MVKKKKKTKVIKDKFIQDVLNKQIQERAEQDKSIDLIGKLKGAVIILALLTFFSAGWFPFGLIDKYHMSKKEINLEWSKAYEPLFEWCDNYTKDNHTAFNYKLGNDPGMTSDRYNRLSPDVLKCVEDKKLRTYLFNNQPFKIKANKSIKSFFNKIPEEIKNFKMNSSGDLVELNNIQINTNTNSWGWGSFDDFEEFQKMIWYDDDRDDGQYFCIGDAIGLFCDRSYLLWSEDKKKEVFRLGFLSDKNFWLISMACRNNCLADIKYFTENGVNYIKEFKLHNYVPHEFDDFSDKNSEAFKEYDKMIKTLDAKISELADKYEKPAWSLRIDL